MGLYIYTVGAHPLDDPEPYSGNSTRTRYSKYRQPRTYERRVELAKKHNQSDPLSDRVTMLVDDLSPHNVTMNGSNPVWCQWGPAPNAGWVINKDGFVEMDMFWFNADVIDAL